MIEFDLCNKRNVICFEGAKLKLLTIQGQIKVIFSMFFLTFGCEKFRSLNYNLQQFCC